jgi:hypothetical protein
MERMTAIVTGGTGGIGSVISGSWRMIILPL